LTKRKLTMAPGALYITI